MTGELRGQRDGLAGSNELARRDEELRATNEHLTGLYAQLSAELEETNRGVVAVYAELDDKTAQLHAASESKSLFLPVQPPPQPGSPPPDPGSPAGAAEPARAPGREPAP